MTSKTTKNDEQPFEFVLYVNNNIVCQRDFGINDYNHEVLKSEELKELMDNLCGMSLGSFGELGLIPSHLKNKSVEYLWNNYNPYVEQTDENYRMVPKKDDVFKFEIKYHKRVVASALFMNEFFTLTPKVGVDIREITKTIMNEIRLYFSLKNYTRVLSK